MSASTNKYIDPLSDFGFKHLFGGEPNKEIMIAFLNALFEGEKRITDLVYNPTELAGDDREHKKVSFDLLCTGDNGEQFIVEMQRADHDNFEDRCIFYLSRLIHQQKLKSNRHWEVKMKEVFLIAILDFNMKNCLSDHYLQSISLVNTGTGEIFHNGLGFKFLELPKFGKKEDELENELDKWVYLLKHMHSLDQIPKYLDKRVFEKIFNIAEMKKLSPEQQFVYDSILQREEDDYSRLKSAERRGMREGIEKGKEEGIEQGVERGMERGKHETALAIARKMKEENFDPVKIAGFTALSIEEIERL
ncbi:hypothetical protein AY601_3651 [Pedobacter cryoconitis]|uniref:Transposase/invertase (TIGR01784 family) n=1 Tax=Pedobacter cryoconitis TaxID=188932 RepID=A0A127VGL8_9SPHI|nr:Rpn family recombination-promoting nuclease/putative transposase [Pedobacter cryoconitis]AMQ00513.1 hypothetical protein AY601_3651 [Pedobacter cryoconitis]